MRKHFTIYIPLIMLYISVASCNYVKFTTMRKEQLVNEKMPIEKVQFYNNNKIVLSRTMRSEEGTTISSGVIKTENGSQSQVITFPPYTMGVCTDSTPKGLKISFEEGGELLFEEDINHQYSLKIGTPNISNGVYYKGEEYYLGKGNADVVLLVKSTHHSTSSKDSHMVKGIKVQ